MSSWRSHRQARQRHHKPIRSPVSSLVLEVALPLISTLTYSSFRYSDLYVSTQAGLGSFLGNRSINVHSSNVTRLACANFKLVSTTCNNSTIGSNSTTSSPTPKPFLGSASTMFVSIGAVAAGVVAFLL